MNLERPLIVFDLETTGVNTATDRIVQLGVCKIHPDGTRVSHKMLVCPEMPIPPKATAVHGITDEMVKDEPSFGKIAEKLFKSFDGCDLGGYNIIRFDIPLLSEEFSRVGIVFPDPSVRVFDAMVVYHKHNPRDLAAAYSNYCGQRIVNAHDALEDVKATVEVMFKQFETHKIGTTMNEISEFCGTKDIVDWSGKIKRSETGEYVYGFGKHKGEPILKNWDTRQYADWMINKGDFSEETKRILREIIVNK